MVQVSITISVQSNYKNVDYSRNGDQLVENGNTEVMPFIPEKRSREFETLRITDCEL